MKYRIVKYTVDNEEYFIVQKRFLRFFWKSYIYEYGYATDIVPVEFPSYDKAYAALQEKIINSKKNESVVYTYFYDDDSILSKNSRK